MAKVAQLEFKSVEAKTVSVAGDFNDWAGSAKGKFDPSTCRMTLKDVGHWVFPLTGVSPGRHEFKFVIDGQWEPGPNRCFHLDEKGRLTDPTGGIVIATLEDQRTIRIQFSALATLPRFLDKEAFRVLPQGTILSMTRREGLRGNGEVIDLHCRDLDPTTPLQVEVKGLGDKPVVRPIHPDGLFQKAFRSTKPLGPRVEGSPPVTVFRVFAPRARRVVLHRFADPTMERSLGTHPGVRDDDGVWEMRVPGTHWNTYYGFTVEGPTGEGEGFKPDRIWPDPWGYASVFHTGPSILIDREALGHGFQGWTDHDFRPPRKCDLVIYEASVRDLTSHPSSKVVKERRGKYLGLASTLGTGTGLDHLKALGVNAIEFLPIFEFDDQPPGTYHWGYMPSLFFCPEASYAMHTLGGQINECKAMIDACHRAGLAVLLDVVYNHTGSPDVLMGFDKKYFYRHAGDFTLYNYSGCGNDFKTENPMARRLILDSLEYWVREFHVDGFRFDLAELIDLDTLQAIEERLRRIKPDIILIAEPWSFRGSLKGRLKGTPWASWNDDFRNRVKEVALGKADGASLLPLLRGSLELWTDHPLESVNYVESHDDYTLTDYLSRRADHDGSKHSETDVRRNLFCAAAVLLAAGIPMLAQGQEMLRSKRGNHNSYNAGDEVNTVDYGLREKNAAVFACYRDLIAFRQSEAGRIIREADPATCRAAERLTGSKPGAAGLFWKPPAVDPLAPPGPSPLLVLFNGESHAHATFKVALPPGLWMRVIGNHRLYRPTDFTRREMLITPSDEEPATFDLPPLGFEVWMPKQRVPSGG
ncbi:MAG: Glycogen debranching enzyme [Candidatus Ozemobacter sibiricus]|jgi:pullulanase/glycogen debranching enzyme|uniref:Glycogen debranching enzyme n=1 Tax=Candidatus Ozemobacter sibiricus TaxID=2268124 RepID=A0A367ZKR4_9BACT|nr:MAG: Glycogen debranching enzyme [Candidatus Ozemobacter sibiricus]